MIICVPYLSIFPTHHFTCTGTCKHVYRYERRRPHQNHAPKYCSSSSVTELVVNLFETSATLVQPFGLFAITFIFYFTFLLFCLQFPQLLRDVHQFQSTVANPQLRLLPLLNKLCDALESEDKSAVHTALSEQMAWDRTTRQFLSSLQTNYVCYHDLLLPFMAGVVAVQSGLQWMAAALEVSSSLETQLPPSVRVSSLSHSNKALNFWFTEAITSRRIGQEFGDIPSQRICQEACRESGA